MQASGTALAADFTVIWQNALQLCLLEPTGRVVRTRHGDAMLLSQFLITRVVELAVDGLDLASALGREAWLTPRAADLVLELLLGSNWRKSVRALGWDQVELLRRATAVSRWSPGKSPRSSNSE